MKLSASTSDFPKDDDAIVVPVGFYCSGEVVGKILLHLTKRALDEIEVLILFRDIDHGGAWFFTGENCRGTENPDHVTE